MSRTRYIYVAPSRRREYGFWSFVGDAIMFCITGGLWFIWIFCREMRRR